MKILKKKKGIVLAVLMSFVAVISSTVLTSAKKEELTLTKTANPSVLNLQVGQSANVTYTITVGGIKSWKDDKKGDKKDEKKVVALDKKGDKKDEKKDKKDSNWKKGVKVEDTNLTEPLVFEQNGSQNYQKLFTCETPGTTVNENTATIVKKERENNDATIKSKNENGNGNGKTISAKASVTLNCTTPTTNGTITNIQGGQGGSAVAISGGTVDAGLGGGGEFPAGLGGGGALPETLVAAGTPNEALLSIYAMFTAYLIIVLRKRFFLQN